MSETIPVTFDPSILPDWAQRNPDVVWLARRNHDFRCEVCRVESAALRSLLIDRAHKTRNGTL